MDPNVRGEARLALAERIALTDASELRVGGKLIKNEHRERIEDFPSVKHDKKKGDDKLNINELLTRDDLR